MFIDNIDYTLFTKPENDLSSIENQFILNDFDINTPIDFNADHRLPINILNQYIESLEIIGIYNPSTKLNIDDYETIKKRIQVDFIRLATALNTMNLSNLNDVLFVTIGNSMESYGYIMNKIFTQYKIGHIKVSRTLKDNVEKHIGKYNRINLFHQYFEQKITEIIQKHENIKTITTIIIIDTFGAGETMSTIMHPFIQKGLLNYPSLKIIPVCLLEGGHTKPTPPYDVNIKVVHLSEADEYIEQMDYFRKTTSENAQMPVFMFNEYIPLNLVEECINGYDKTKTELNKNNSLINRFGLKKLKIFLDTQIIDLKNKENYIVIPSQTTRLLSHINPYFTIAQKTVFIAQENKSKKFITRDGHGFSRKERPPIKLHQLNNDTSFSQLPIIDKIKLSFNKNIELFNIVSNEVRNIVSILNDNDLNQLKDAFESYLRKKIIYHFLSIFEIETSKSKKCVI